MKFYVPRPQSLLLYASILFMVCLTIGAFTLSGEIGSKEIGASLLSVFGTFLGAFLAFRLNENKEYERREEEKKQALNRALFILARQVNAIQNIQKTISPYEKDDMRAFNLPALYLPNYSDLVQKIDELDFLLAESDPNILLELDNEQKCFDQMIKAYTARTDFMFHEVQPAISQNQLNVSAPATAVYSAWRDVG